MMKTPIPFFSALFLACLIGSSASAALEPNQIREALPKKTEMYLKEGVFSGGDREVRAGLVKDIRRAANGGFERIVIDLDSVTAPYYQASIEPSQRRILFTLFGSLRLGIDAKKIIAHFKKSPLISRVEFFPKVEDDAWTFALHLKNAVPVEVFELAAPTRIVVDLKNGAITSAAATTPKKSVAPKLRAAPARVVEEETDQGNGASGQSEEIPE